MNSRTAKYGRNLQPTSFEAEAFEVGEDGDE